MKTSSLALLSPLFALLCLGLGLLALPACAPTRSGDDDDSVGDDDDSVGGDEDVTYGWSFGECWGSCRGELTLTDGDEVHYLVRGWDEQVFQEFTGQLTSAGVDLIEAALEDLDPDTLEDVYGCPDCADGGAEQWSWPELSGAPATSHEWGNPPTELAAARSAMRVFVEEIEWCQLGTHVEETSCIPLYQDVPGDGNEGDEGDGDEGDDDPGDEAPPVIG